MSWPPCPLCGPPANLRPVQPERPGIPAVYVCRACHRRGPLTYAELTAEHEHSKVLPFALDGLMTAAELERVAAAHHDRRARDGSILRWNELTSFGRAVRAFELADLVVALHGAGFKVVPR